MKDRGAEIAELRDKTERTRFEFLETELQTCRLALEFARSEFHRGNFRFAGQEKATAESGFRVIERFLPEVREDRRAPIQAGLERLRELHDAVAKEMRGSAESEN